MELLCFQAFIKQFGFAIHSEHRSPKSTGQNNTQTGAKLEKAAQFINNSI